MTLLTKVMTVQATRDPAPVPNSACSSSSFCPFVCPSLFNFVLDTTTGCLGFAFGFVLGLGLGITSG